jgi:hypothetical protein
VIDTRQRNALQKAVALGGARLVRRVRYGLYRVPSASDGGREYTVTVDGRGRYGCDCPAGLAGNPCWHKASVYIAKVEHASGGRVTAPAATSGSERSN